MLEETWFYKLSELSYHKENLSVNVTLEEEGSELLPKDQQQWQIYYLSLLNITTFSKKKKWFHDILWQKDNKPTLPCPHNVISSREYYKDYILLNYKNYTKYAQQ